MHGLTWPAAAASRDDARRVRRARLCPAAADDTPALRFALEDALHTAEFNDCGRLVVVRQLRLAGLPRRPGPALLARALEHAWQAAARHAVPASHMQAAAAPAVYFGSRAEARLAWLAAAAEASAAPVAWFWPAALPELSRAVSTAVAPPLRRVLDVALADGAPALWRALQAWPTARLLALAALTDTATGERLLEAATVPGGAADAAPEASAEEPPAPRTPRASLQPRQAMWARLAQRAAAAPALPPAWVAAVWMAPASGVATATRAQVQLALQQLAWSQYRRAAGDRLSAETLSPTAPLLPSRPRDTPGPQPVANGRGGPAHATPAAAHASGTAPTAAALRVEAGLRPSPRARTDPRPRERHAEACLPWLADAAFTQHGGLLLLLNLLQALHFDGQPAGLCDALLWRVLDLTGAPRADPQRRWFDGAADAAFEDARLPRRWLLQARRALRRYARIDLTALVCRRAWVSATPTHLDAIYPLDDVDLRLRRAGLDRDPGWLPWFGRIVHFHFVARELLPAADLQEPQHG